MLMEIKRFLKFFLYLLTSYLVLFGIIAPALANPGLTVGGVIVDAKVSPGEEYRHTIRLSLGADDQPTDIQVKVGGFGQNPDGVLRLLSPEADASSYTARGFISLDKTSLHLEPGKREEVTAVISVPRDACAGGYYAAIGVYTALAGSSASPGGSRVGVVSGVEIPVLLTIKGSELIHKGEITALATGAAKPGQPIDIFTTFRNTGNHHFKIKGEVTVSDAQGQALATVPVPLTGNSVKPTFSLRLKARLEGGLPAGTYTVKSRVMLEDGTVLNEATDSFSVLPTKTFSDIAGHWAQKDIEIMAGLGIAQGGGGNRFDPDGKVTRAQFAALLIRSLGIEEVKSARGYFKDVPADAWYYGAVKTAYANGLIGGYPDGTFRPAKNITREEIAAMVVRGLAKSGRDATVADADALLSQFVDTGKISSWARNGVAVAVSEGIVTGRGGGRFAPKDNATRAEAVVMLKRMLVRQGQIPE
jgi:hypothetical protein